MTQQTVATLKSYFQTGFKPTQSQFGDVMDSFVNFLDTSAQSIVSDFNIGGFIAVSANATIGGGIVVGTPTGGLKGNGTVNATEIYINGTLIATTSAGGSGTVNNGTANQLAYYPTSTNSVSGTNALPNGTTATTQTAGDASTKVCTNQYVDRGASGASMVLLSEQTASNSATLSFTNMTGYDNYRLLIGGMQPVTNGANLICRVSENNGSTYISTTNYESAGVILIPGGTTGSSGNTGETALFLTAAAPISNNVSLGLNGSADFYNMASSSIVKSVNIDMSFFRSADNAMLVVRGATCYTGDAAVLNAIQISCDTGNISAGKFSLYGIRNA